MDSTIFRERVLPASSFFIYWLLLPVAIWLVFLPINNFVGICLAATAYFAVVLIAFLGSPVITVDNENLSIGRVTLPRKYVGEIKVLSTKLNSSVTGIELSALAYTRFQIGVKSLVKVENTDRKDPVPYLLFSCRNAEGLAGALDADKS